ncbi:hypothetical protein ABT404_24590 [Streptomyces hyaluromycini]|uniref:Secreted protein n=1 Tax=Streptomyces hyaluromycini TaxID=1377993 RepID=A0ABV1X0T0_9ACTN
MKRFPIAALVTAAVLAASGTAIAVTRETADQPDGRKTGRPPVVKPAAAQAEVYTWVHGPHVVVPPGQARSTEALCPAGQVPTGGGYNGADGGIISIVVRTNSPTTQGWNVAGLNTSSTRSVELWSEAICAPGTQAEVGPPAAVAK